MGLDPKLWGREVWSCLDMLVVAYPEKPSASQVRSMNLVLVNLANVLPCPSCALHMRNYLQSHPPRCGTRHELRDWLLKFHNSVNRRTNKKEWTQEEADKALVKRILGRESDNKSHQRNNKGAIVLALIIGFFLALFTVWVCRKYSSKKKLKKSF